MKKPRQRLPSHRRSRPVGRETVVIPDGDGDVPDSTALRMVVGLVSVAQWPHLLDNRPPSGRTRGSCSRLLVVLWGWQLFLETGYGCSLVTVGVLRTRRVTGFCPGSPCCCWQWQGRTRPPHCLQTALVAVVVVLLELPVCCTLVDFAGVGGNGFITVTSSCMGPHVFCQ